MDTRTILIGGGIAALLLVGGVFLWMSSAWAPTESPSAADYEIIETDNGTLVRNERAGVTVPVPDGWRVQKIDVLEGSVVMYSPDAASDQPGAFIRPPLSAGCMAEIAMRYSSTTLDSLKDEVKKSHQNLLVVRDEFTDISIGGFESLKNLIETENLGAGIIVYTPLVDRLFGLILDFDLEAEQVCEEYLDAMTAGISFF